ncbi:Condensin-2 complex subunit H2 [Linum perenne]
MMSTHIDKSSDRIHTVQAERDLEANWDVDLARKLEDYLLKICSGEISGTEDDAAHISINFAEAALLLQGSVQVYSRKVEYLYNLVLHALDFLSEKRQQGELEGLTEQPEKAASRCGNDDEDDQFWGLDDIPVEPRNCLDTSTSKDALFYNFTKPPANLVVLEADCLDTSGDGGELESYLLASSDLYRDFILLDPCDAPSVNNFLEEGGTGVGTTYRGSSTHKGIHSSRKRTGATGRRSSLGKNHDAPLNQSPIPDCGLQDDKCDVNPGPSKDVNFEGCSQRFDMDDMYSPPGNLDDTDLDEDETDPWKPLNPHEPGDLKVKPFKRVSLRKHVGNTPTLTSIAALFPLAKMHHGPISSELKDMWDLRQNSCNEHKNSQSDPAPLYEKLRESLASGGKNNGGFIPHSNNDDWDNENDNGVPAEPYGEMPESSFMDEDLPLPHDKDFDSASRFDADDPFGQREPSSQASLEDLCRSHLTAVSSQITKPSTCTASQITPSQFFTSKNIRETGSLNCKKTLSTGHGINFLAGF